MSFETLLTIGIIFFYSLGSLGIFLGTLSARRSVKAAANWLTLVGFALHTICCVTTFVVHSYEELTGGYYMQMLAWVVIALHLAAWRWFRLPFLGLTAAPLALVLYAFSLRFINVQNLLPENFSGLFFWLHILSLFLSMGLLVMAFCSGLLFVYIDRKIKKKEPLTGIMRTLPALSIYDKVNEFAVVAGFPLYTLGLMSGFIWSPMLLQTVENPKVLLSTFIWALYAFLFYQRMALGYRGRKTAVMAIIIFGISVLSISIDYTVTHHSIQLLP